MRMIDDCTSEAPHTHAGLRARFTETASDSWIDDLQLRTGSLRDYALLGRYHYRATKPATASRVLVLEHAQPSVVGRYLGRREQKQVAAVLVESLPTLNCRMREYALDARIGRWLDARSRAAMLNAELRCISRVVVHPQWRGCGLAVRLVRAALDQATTSYTEALAAMGHVSPFFEKAGMTAYRRPPHTHDQRLLDALASAGFSELDLASPDALWEKIKAMTQTKQIWLLKELRRWTRSHRRQAHAADDDPRNQLRLAQQRLAFEPVYYLHWRDG